MDTAEKGIYQGFWISVLLKGAISLAEVAAGIVIFFIAPSLILHLMMQVVQSGIVGSPTGFVGAQLIKTAEEFTRGTQLFVAFYLFTRGIIKLLLIVALLMNKLWAYPASLVVLGGFVIYQAYQIATTHSLLVTGITIFDLIVMYFIWREYLVVKEHHGLRPSFGKAATAADLPG